MKNQTHLQISLLTLSLLVFAFAAPLTVEAQLPDENQPTLLQPSSTLTAQTSTLNPSPTPDENYPSLLGPSTVTSASTTTFQNYVSTAENYFGGQYSTYSPYVEQYKPPQDENQYFNFLENYATTIQQYLPSMDNVGQFYETTYQSTAFQSVLASTSTTQAFSLIENYPDLMQVYNHLSPTDTSYTQYSALVDENYQPPDWVKENWKIESNYWVPPENWKVPEGYVPSTSWTVPDNWTPPENMLDYVVPPWMPENSWETPENWAPASDWVPPENWTTSTTTLPSSGMFKKFWEAGAPSGFENIVVTENESAFSVPPWLNPEENHWIPRENTPFWVCQTENITPGGQVNVYIEDNALPWMMSESGGAWTQGSTTTAGTNVFVGGLKMYFKESAQSENLNLTVQELTSLPENLLPPMENSYQLLQIGTDLEESVENAEVGFKVSWEWINAEGMDENTITLEHYVDGTWDELPTTMTGNDENYVYFDAETPGFSVFAVTGEVATAATLPTQPFAGVPPMWVVAIAAVVMIGILIGVIWRYLSHGMKSTKI
jgi:PGF-pre-PGF domain-containing protein